MKCDVFLFDFVMFDSFFISLICKLEHATDLNVVNFKIVGLNQLSIVNITICIDGMDTDNTTTIIYKVK